ncbi:hypothetical protein L596_028142 [Steinernema carpocapsae]|uniref:Uncharacterized protein n=1 Tax=Steinernema carpocapsae TaxID=34508 RepID=A0A4V6XVN0_STECR|nr:hypothetical protein L596_028142 [Steinernema carpocapsae]
MVELASEIGRNTLQWQRNKARNKHKKSGRPDEMDAKIFFSLVEKDIRRESPKKKSKPYRRAELAPRRHLPPSNARADRSMSARIHDETDRSFATSQHDSAPELSGLAPFFGPPCMSESPDVFLSQNNTRLWCDHALRIPAENTYQITQNADDRS